MCLPALAALSTMQTIGLGASALGAGIGAVGAYQQARVSKDMANYNATLAERNAQDSQRKGEMEAQRVAREGRQLAGAQRASFAARGIDAGVGTAADVLDQTDFFSLADQGTVRDNAAREAWNYRSQGAGFRAQADATKPGLMAASTLLGGAGSVADRWYRYTGN